MRIEKNLLIVILIVLSEVLKTACIQYLVEETNMDESSLVKSLNAKGITIVGQYFTYDKSIDKSDIVSQINLMVDFHKTLKGCRSNELNRIKSTIGKEVEGYKVQIRRLQKCYGNIASKTCSDAIEKLILSNGKMMLNKAEQAIDYIQKHDYLGVIERSMNREEVCIGKADRNNLRMRGQRIEIGTIKNISYNLVEEDLYNYIKKLQRKELDIDEEELIKAFVCRSHLSFNSIDYLRGLLSYPKDFFKVWERYSENKKEHTNKIYSINKKDNEENKSNKEESKKKERSEAEMLLALNKCLKYESKMLKF